MLGGVLAVREEARGLDHDLYAQLAPGQRGRVLLREHLELLAVDEDRVVGGLHLTRERAEDRVVLEQVGERARVGDVVDPDPVDVGALRVRRPEYVSADSAEAVYSGPYRHPAVLSLVWFPENRNLSAGREAAGGAAATASGPAGRLVGVEVDELEGHVLGVC